MAAAPPRSTASTCTRGDSLFFFGCLLCGSWILGLPGALIALTGLYLIRRGGGAGARRPMVIILAAGWILLESSVRYIALGMDLLPAHSVGIVRTLWIDYGLFADGGYALYYGIPHQLGYNTAAIGGTSVPIEKSIQVASIILVMPIRIAAAWGLLRMRRWGLQWSIVGAWMALTLWVIHAAAMSNQYELRFGTSEFGVLGFWLIGGLPLLAPIVLLPFLHTVNRRAFAE